MTSNRGQPAGAASPLGKTVRTGTIPQRGLELEINADENQRARLAQRHGLQSVNALTAILTVRNWKRDGIRVTGNIRATVTQTCVVTLEPVKSVIDEAMDIVLVPEDSPSALTIARDDEAFSDDPDGIADYDVYSGSAVDVGALAEEYFAMGIDPYPRKPGATLPEEYADEGDDDDRRNPFAELSKLKPKR